MRTKEEIMEIIYSDVVCEDNNGNVFNRAVSGNTKMEVLQLSKIDNLTDIVL